MRITENTHPRKRQSTSLIMGEMQNRTTVRRDRTLPRWSKLGRLTTLRREEVGQRDAPHCLKNTTGTVTQTCTANRVRLTRAVWNSEVKGDGQSFLSMRVNSRTTP